MGGCTRGKGCGVHDRVLVADAVEVRQRKRTSSLNRRKAGRYVGRVRHPLVLTAAPSRSVTSLRATWLPMQPSSPTARVVTPNWRERGYSHSAIAERSDIQVADIFLPIIHLVFSNLKTWLRASITMSARSIYKPTSTNSLSASTAGSIPSTTSAPCAASPVMSPRRLKLSFTPTNPAPLYLVGGL